MSHRALSEQQFFHGTRRNLPVGGELKPGIRPNFANSSLQHVYMTESEDDAIGWAKSAQGRGRPRVYRVEPVGSTTPDPEGYGHMAAGARIVEKTYDEKPPPRRPRSAEDDALLDRMFGPKKTRNR